MSLDLKVPPLSLCRIILNEKYSKNDVKEMLKDPNLIPDPLLSANCLMCIFNDNQDGPLIDMIRYSVGEEYEIKLKNLARQAGLSFYDENNLRRDGYDKTPDLLLAIPCIYKNTIINWIESKASFGDEESHTKYYKDQLSCYTNRFNTGIVIYWFGFHEDILTTKNLIILDNFPPASEFQKLEFNKKT
jgi:CDAN1-interacting nuclease 1